MSALSAIAKHEYYVELGNSLPPPVLDKPEYRERRLHHRDRDVRSPAPRRRLRSAPGGADRAVRRACRREPAPGRRLPGGFCQNDPLPCPGGQPDARGTRGRAHAGAGAEAAAGDASAVAGASAARSQRWRLPRRTSRAPVRAAAQSRPRKRRRSLRPPCRRARLSPGRRRRPRRRRCRRRPTAPSRPRRSPRPRPSRRRTRGRGADPPRPRRHADGTRRISAIVTLPTDPAVIDALVRGTSDVLTLLDEVGGDELDEAA